jgi:hypothetical protein
MNRHWGLWIVASSTALSACSTDAVQEGHGSIEQAATGGAFVQQAYTCPQASQSTTAVALSASETSGDTNVVIVGWNDVTSTIVSVTDTQGNVYSVAAPITRNANGPNSQAVYYAPNVKATTNKVTVMLSAAAWFMDVRVLEYAGALTLHTSASAAGTATTASAGPMSLSAGELVVAAGTTYGEFIGAGSGYTLRVITTPNSDLVEDLSTTTAGAVTATAPDDGSPWVFQAAAFRTATSGDAGVDAARDAAQDTGVDASAEAGRDADLEAGRDATVDAGSEASVDATPDSTSDSGPPAVPTLVQHVGSSTETLDRGIHGNNIKFSPPNPVLAGNCLILGVAYTSGTAFAAAPVTDSMGNVWPTSPSARRADSNANMDLAIFVLPNALPGADTVTLHFATTLPQFSFSFSEFSGIAAVSPVSGSSGASNVLAPNLSTGSFTPARNDGSGGNLVWSYFFDDSNFGSGNEVTSFVPGAGFSLLDADIAWHRSTNVHHVAEYTVQTVAAPISPSLTASMSPTADGFIGLSIALKAASTGTPPPSSGIRIAKILHNTNEVPPGTWTVQAPSSGNAVVFSTANASGFSNITSITDSKGNTYVKYEPDGSEPIFFVAANAVTGNDLVLTIHISGTSAGMSFSILDIRGAAKSPVDAVGDMPGIGCSSVTSVTNAPTITPTGPGLTLVTMGIGQGPGLGVSSPAGAVFDLATYTNETDLDTIENADCRAHLYNTSAGVESWSWTITSKPNNSCFADAIHLLPQ